MRCLRCIGARLSGPRAFEGFEFLMAEMVCSIVILIGVVFRFCSCLRVVRLVLSGVKFVGLVKCLLKEFAMFLLEVLVWLLNFIERLGSVFVGDLLFSDFMVFQ